MEAHYAHLYDLVEKSDMDVFIMASLKVIKMYIKFDVSRRLHKTEVKYSWKTSGVGKGNVSIDVIILLI